MEYLDIYRVLERRWQTAPGIRFTDFSRWRQPKGAVGDQVRLMLLIEDQATMRRFCISHVDGPVVIAYTPMTGQGTTGTIHCKDQAQAAKELEYLFARLDQAA